MQNWWSCNEATATDASEERNCKKISKKKIKFYQEKVDQDSKNTEGTSEGRKDGKNKKCRFCGRIHRPKMCPAYSKECKKCKKKIFGQVAVRIKLLNETICNRNNHWSWYNKCTCMWSNINYQNWGIRWKS